MRVRSTGWAWVAIAAVAVAALAAQAVSAGEFTLEVAAGASDRLDTPVSAVLELPAKPSPDVSAMLRGPGGTVPGQLEAIEGNQVRLWWIVGSLKAGQKATYRATIEAKPAAEKGFAFRFPLRTATRTGVWTYPSGRCAFPMMAMISSRRFSHWRFGSIARTPHTASIHL